MSHVIGYGDCLYRTILFALLTANTAVVAGIHCCFTFIQRTASHSHFLIIRYQFNQMMRTYGYAFAAGFAFLFVNDSDTIFNMDGIKGTCFYTGTVAKAALVTFFCSASRNKCHDGTIFDTIIYVIFTGMFAADPHG